MKSLALLVSGGLGFNLLKKLSDSDHLINAVFTDKQSTQIIEFCQRHEYPIFAGNPRNGKAADFIKTVECDVLLSINYLFIVEEDIINLPREYAINFHGSLLPKYKGRTPHVWAIINGEKETGVTAHIIEAKVDNGAIVSQVKIEIGGEDTGANILSRFQEIYPKMVFEILTTIEAGNLKLVPQQKELATYFGKRTPSDGQIDWNWSKGRIRNWIRAQAKPYPGAFAYFENEKITIHSSQFSNMGFDYTQVNGTILSVTSNSIVVKTPNGALELSGLEYEGNINFDKDTVLI